VTGAAAAAMAVCSASQPVLAGSARAAYRHVRIVQLVGATPTEVGCWHAPQGYARGREPFHTLTGLFAGGAAGRPPAAAASLLALLCAWHAEPADPVAWADARAPQATAAEALRGCLRAWAADCLLAAPAAERALLLQARACRCLPTGSARAGRPPSPFVLQSACPASRPVVNTVARLCTRLCVRSDAARLHPRPGLPRLPQRSCCHSV